MEALRKGDDCYSNFEGFEEFDNAHSEYDLNTTWNRYYDADNSAWGTLFFNAVEVDNMSIVNH